MHQPKERTVHSMACYTSCETLAGTRNSSMGPSRPQQKVTIRIYTLKTWYCSFFVNKVLRIECKYLCYPMDTDAFFHGTVFICGDNTITNVVQINLLKWILIKHTLFSPFSLIKLQTMLTISLQLNPTALWINGLTQIMSATLRKLDNCFTS